MLHIITHIAAVNPGGFTVDCCFDQSASLRRIPLVDLVQELAQAPHLAQLAEPAFFARVALNAYGTLVWPNEVDFCPDVLYARSQPVEE